MIITHLERRFERERLSWRGEGERRRGGERERERAGERLRAGDRERARASRSLALRGGDRLRSRARLRSCGASASCKHRRANMNSTSIESSQ